MRVTTKILQNNSLQNINTNKELQDKLSNQLSTEKKVNRPSDDPIVAIRALRLRTNVNQITQYYEKNAPDAESWLSVTESALSSMSEVVTSMYEQCTKGSNEYLTSTDRQTILTSLTKLRDEVYSTGNADYAGRTIFTGYRTDTTLTYTADETKQYSITEQLQNSKIDSITYVNTGNLNSINESNFNSDDADGDGTADADGGYAAIDENLVTATSVHRLRLSYDSVDGVEPKIEVSDGNGGYEDITAANTAFSYSTASIYDTDNPYLNVGDDDIVLVEETGELLLGDNVYSALMSLKDDPTTKTDEGEFRVTYEKSSWESGDLRPEHYFACTATGTDGTTIDYNQNYLDGITEKQAIEYDVGLNQTIRVNTTADEVFQHDIGRDVDDMINALEDTISMETTVNKLQSMVDSGSYSGTDLDTLNDQLAAAEKAFTLLKENTQKVFESGISKMQSHLDTVNYAVTQNGTRSQQLELITNRLMNQKTNFETLQSDNEDVDISEVAIQLSSAELTYNAALMATSKILQTNLMNFI